MRMVMPCFLGETHQSIAMNVSDSVGYTPALWGNPTMKAMGTTIRIAKDEEWITIDKLNIFKRPIFKRPFVVPLEEQVVEGAGMENYIHARVFT